MAIKICVSPSSNPQISEFQAFNSKIAPRAIDGMMFFQNFPGEPILYSAYLTTFRAALGNPFPQSTWSGSSSTIIADINAGTYDAYIDGEAATCVSYGGLIQLRFMHEFNGNWTAYGPSSASAAAFVSAWQRVHNRFVAAGATNVKWVWSPNVWLNSGGSIADPSTRYPGDAYVDYIGLDAYMNLLNGQWFTYRELVLAEYKVLTALAPSKPFHVSEHGQGEHDVRGSRVVWYQGWRDTIMVDLPRTEQVTFFNRDLTGVGEGDYTIDVSGTQPASLSTVQRILNDPPFVDRAPRSSGTWSIGCRS